MEDMVTRVPPRWFRGGDKRGGRKREARWKVERVLVRNVVSMRE